MVAFVDPALLPNWLLLVAVVWLQIRMRDLAVGAAYHGQPLPVLYEIYYRRWFLLGWRAFIGVLIIFYLMVAKPAM